MQEAVCWVVWRQWRPTAPSDETSMTTVAITGEQPCAWLRRCSWSAAVWCCYASDSVPLTFHIQWQWTYNHSCVQQPRADPPMMTATPASSSSARRRWDMIESVRYSSWNCLRLYTARVLSCRLLLRHCWFCCSSTAPSSVGCRNGRCSQQRTEQTPFASSKRQTNDENRMSILTKRTWAFVTTCLLWAVWSVRRCVVLMRAWWWSGAP